MRILMLVILLLAVGSLKAQLRHVKGVSALSVGGGVVSDGYLVKAGYGHLFNEKLMVRGSVFYESCDIGTSHSDQGGFSPECLYTVKNIGQVLFINVCGGVIFGKEKVNNPILKASESSFVFGESVGVEPEVFLSNRISLSIGIHQRWYQRYLSGNASVIFSSSINFSL